ncbi:DUF721 domain-containing protein [Desulfobulbus alkaliphilus]|uniref:DUF721 domain-containing protein n=1 Tax=Desulfobulbus alkaliphilus TaxID=869814 RepID=UPI001962BD69|nr:DUF721 domain-containing protein [Desulfobulbus alkaliphilus]MBM9538134.1 DUF721 domain-containing protein [Desulfobulbus alkaliphilus]
MRKRKAERAGGPFIVGDSLAGLYASQQWQQHWRLFRLARDWPGIVGEQVARLTAPALFRHNVLWVHVQDSSSMHHLQFVKLDLLARVNQVLGDRPASDIRWMLQPASPPEPEFPNEELRPVSPEAEQYFAEMTCGIADQECRQALYRLWRNYSARVGSKE